MLVRRPVVAVVVVGVGVVVVEMVGLGMIGEMVVRRTKRWEECVTGVGGLSVQIFWWWWWW